MSEQPNQTEGESDGDYIHRLADHFGILRYMTKVVQAPEIIGWPTDTSRPTGRLHLTMSELIRYTPLLQCVEPSYQRQEIESKLIPLSDGEWVKWEDYAKVKDAGQNILQHLRETVAENARLKAEVERLDTLCKKLGKLYSDISCENIMLRKAGDAMAYAMDQNGCHDNGCYEQNEEAMRLWNAAKEGETK